MSGNSSKITTDLAVDTPLAQSAGYRFDKNDRQYIDNQVLGCQQHLVSSVISGTHATYATIDGSSASIAVGDCVCLASSSGSAPKVTKAVAAALSNAKAVFGIALQSGTAGAKIQVAISGMVSSTITGLDAAASGFVRVNTTTARCEQVPYFTSLDYKVGCVDNAGALTIGGGAVSTGGASIIDAVWYSGPGTVTTSSSTYANFTGFHLNVNVPETRVVQVSAQISFAKITSTGIVAIRLRYDSGTITEGYSASTASGSNGTAVTSGLAALNPGDNNFYLDWKVTAGGANVVGGTDYAQMIIF